MIKPKKIISSILLCTSLLSISLNAGFWDSAKYTVGKGATVNPAQILHLLNNFKANSVACYTEAISTDPKEFLVMVETCIKVPRKMDALTSFLQANSPYKTKGFKSWAKFAGKSLKYEWANYIAWYLSMLNDVEGVGSLFKYLEKQISLIFWLPLVAVFSVFEYNEDALPYLRSALLSYMTEITAGVSGSMLLLKQLDSWNAKKLAVFLVENYDKLKGILGIQDLDTREFEIEILLEEYYKTKFTTKAITQDKDLLKIIGTKTGINCLGYLISSLINPNNLGAAEVAEEEEEEVHLKYRKDRNAT